jgi:hypothetical protein
MNISLVGAFFAILGIAIVAFIWFSPAFRLARWAKQAARWDYATANAHFLEARRTVVSQLRHPQGHTGQALADAAFEVAVACTDRINELNGKEHGAAHHAKLHRTLLRVFQREADYWVSNDYGIESLGRDQEPALYAGQHKMSSAPRSAH